MRYTALALLPVLALAACATPRQQCDRAAVRDRDTVGALIIETEQNLTRGYAIETELRSQPRFQFCYGHHPNRNVGMVLCNSTETVEVERPV
ncbi:hypothetical protein HA397_26305, partial [Escherichia coli]|nr:hypothetical protein [Escherichia coli]